MSINPLVARLRNWATLFFDELWRLIPAEPYLFPFLLLGGIVALIWPPAHGLLAGEIYAPWVTLALASPVMVLLAWHMVMHRTGQTRYNGLLIRLGGDAGQFFVVATYLLARIVEPGLDNRDYGLVVVGGVLAFLFILVARDVWALWLVNQVASKLSLELNRAKDAGP